MSNDINKLRETLFATLEGIKDGTIDTEKAKSINDVSQTIINTAKAEIEFAKVNGSVDSSFFNKITLPGAQSLPKEKEVKQIPTGTLERDGGRTVHTMN